ncbi:unnamed protein product [Caenorhabditis bovis]|uniref:Protein arginine methyltransferase NDUFAF7 n=1 Tax=Caenorhabditis bovis TaxID=2654633 RepID=A0A8S1EWE7_9PELO|nr:unnamed protein product [Caenorhabditis bovis]
MLNSRINRVLWHVRRFSKDIITPAGYEKKVVDDHLKRFIVDKIRASGPITVAEYMKTSVSAPTVGYYGRFSKEQNVFGSQGDFITSPELTQLFGEMIGVWIFHELANTGYKGAWNLVELGPGRGQLMADILRSLEKFQDRDATIHLVEMSDALIDEQERFLCVDNSTKPIDPNSSFVRKNKTKEGFDIYWYKSIDDLPDGFSVFIGNEFLDALPVHQFSRSENNDIWNEIYINLDKNNELVFMKSKGENLHTKGLIPKYIRDDASRINWECSPDSGTVVNQIADRITAFGGFSLLIDYGHDGSRNTHSFRAYKNHQQVHPLSDPGHIDLTADVDFGYLSRLINEQTLVFGPIIQREFLAQVGIEHRLRRLLKICADREKQLQLIKSYNMLMGDMGEKFKAISIFPKTLETILTARGGPAGFATGPPKNPTEKTK